MSILFRATVLLSMRFVPFPAICPMHFVSFKVSFVFQKDRRHYITLSTFGFYKGGILTVNLTNFKFEPADADKKLTPETTNKAVVSYNNK